MMKKVVPGDKFEESIVVEVEFKLLEAIPVS